MIFGKSTTKKTVWTIKIQGGGATTLGGGTAISGDGTTKVAERYSDTFRRNLTLCCTVRPSGKIKLLCRFFLDNCAVDS